MLNMFCVQGPRSAGWAIIMHLADFLPELCLTNFWRTFLQDFFPPKFANIESLLKLDNNNWSILNIKGHVGGGYSGTGGEATQASLHSFPSSGSLSICLSPPLSRTYCTVHLLLCLSMKVCHPNIRIYWGTGPWFSWFFTEQTENYPIWFARPVLSILSCLMFPVSVWSILSSLHQSCPALSGPVFLLPVTCSS